MQFLKNIWRSRLVWRAASAITAVLLLAGCSTIRSIWPTPTPTFVPTTTTSPTRTSLPPAFQNGWCLQGEWAAADLSEAIRAVNARQGSPLQVSEVSGEALYRFTQDGHIEININQLNIVLKGQVGGGNVRVIEQMNGQASASYSVDPQGKILTLTNFGGDGIHYQVMMNNLPLSQGNFEAWQAFSALTVGEGSADLTAQPRIVQVAHVQIACTGSELTVQALDPFPGPIMRLERVE